MMPQTPAGEPPLHPAPSAQPTTAKRPRGRWGMLLGFALLLTAGAGGAGWWFRSPSVAPVDLPMPEGIDDAEVRQAIERARRQVLDNARSADAWGRLGMTLLAQLFDRDADRCFAEASRLDPGEPRWLYGRGRIALKRDPDHALPLLRQAVNAAANSSPAHLSDFRLPLAEALLERGELQEAEPLFRQEWQRGSDNPRAALGLGLIAVERGDTRGAVDFLTTAQASPFARKTATAQLAALARRRGDQAGADRYEKEVATLPGDPPWPDPFLDRVMQFRVGLRRQEREVDELERAHRYAEAAEVWLGQLRERRTSRACVGAGINLARIGDYERALPLLREALQLDPESAQGHYTLALTLFTRAEKEWQQSPGSASATEWFRESIRHAQRAAHLKPDYALAYLFWGLARKYLGEPTAAIAPLRQGIACRPESFELQLALGESLLAVGKDREAETHLENARRLDPEDPRPLQATKRLHLRKH
jgi:tetratricopeptide (TPR) repeat protein